MLDTLVFWPGIGHEIIELVSHCSECLTHRNRQQQETLLQHDIPDTPWTKVACDLFTIYGKDYLLVVDYHSKYIEVAHLEKPADSSKVIRGTKNIFSHHGIPKSIFTENGPQFIANGYKQFVKSWDFDHNDTSSPHFPQTMDLLKGQFRQFRQTLKKAHKSGQDIHLALLTLNTTPSRDGLSPAFKMFNTFSITIASLQKIQSLRSTMINGQKIFPNFSQGQWYECRLTQTSLERKQAR